MGKPEEYSEGFEASDSPNFHYILVGKYESKKMPAATLWRGDCEHLPQRYFYDGSKEYAGEYNIQDISDRLSR